MNVDAIRLRIAEAAIEWAQNINAEEALDERLPRRQSNFRFRTAAAGLLQEIRQLVEQLEPYTVAPWHDEEVAALNRWQTAGYVHAFTCANDHDEPRDLLATPSGWTCQHPDCGYTQTWAHKFMLNVPPDPFIDWHEPAFLKPSPPSYDGEIPT